MTDHPTCLPVAFGPAAACRLGPAVAALITGLAVLTAVAEQPLFPYRADGQYIYDRARVTFRTVAVHTTAVDQAACLAVWPDGRFAVAGRDRISVHGADGSRLAEAPLEAGPATALAAAGTNLYVATSDRVTVLDQAGRRRDTWQPLGEEARITGLAATAGAVWICDAGQRRVWRMDPEGRLMGMLPGAGAPRSETFIVPSPSFDAAAAPDGSFWVANPGRHRLQRHAVDGRLLSSWSNEVQRVEGFAGCCNPAKLAVLPDGRIVTSEKMVPRVKTYQTDGRLSALVIPPGRLSGEDARDIGADAAGRIYVLDGATVHVMVEQRQP